MAITEDIKDRIDIVDLISSYITLNKAGANYKAICPFHSEKTPSFIVSPQRQSWRCFGACSTGGDILSFVMKIENIDFYTSIKQLSQQAGINISHSTVQSKSDFLYEINEQAALFFQESLKGETGSIAQKYISKRDLTEKTISEFRIGFSPSSNNSLLDKLLSLGFDKKQIEKTGLSNVSNSGHSKDFFWNRVMFPIENKQGKIVGFGGRSLDESNPKYLNTPKTEIFDKQSILYGLNKAAPSIKNLNCAIIVEGYMDVITAHQNKEQNVIASMGTAITEHQVNSIKRMAKDYVLAMDSDTAGQSATLRSLESAWHVLDSTNQNNYPQNSLLDLGKPPKIRIASLPMGEDPDSLIKNNLNEWKTLIETATPYKEFVIDIVSDKNDKTTPEGKGQIINALLPIITSSKSSVEQEHYVEILSKKIQVSADVIRSNIGRLSRPLARNSKRQKSPSNNSVSLSALKTDPYKTENFIMAILLQFPQPKDEILVSEIEIFQKTENREIFTSYLNSNTIEELELILSPILKEQLNYLLSLKLDPVNEFTAVKALKQSIARLEQIHIKNMQKELLSSIQSDSQNPKEIEKVIVDLNQKLKTNLNEFNQKTT